MPMEFGFSADDFQGDDWWAPEWLLKKLQALEDQLSLQGVGFGAALLMAASPFSGVVKVLVDQAQLAQDGAGPRSHAEAPGALARTPPVDNDTRQPAQLMKRFSLEALARELQLPKAKRMSVWKLRARLMEIPLPEDPEERLEWLHVLYGYTKCKEDPKWTSLPPRPVSGEGAAFLQELMEHRGKPLAWRKSTWRALCLRCHPDKNQDREAATRTFQELSELKPWFLPDV
ncbi:unnamed protein product [Symbiodinium natans]|uniref:J domain-containing protein n=1 Tax=Symbiodinium natans TaxID=878477 RepID=A0A812IMK0_9DINO|nr:unnamed protein product [Symbiodinium natans]